VRLIWQLIDEYILISLSLILIELAIQPTLNASLMARNPNDAPQVGQSSSSSSGEQQGGGQQQSQQQATQPADITVAATAADSTVKADAQATQVTASSMG
jgi:hypothetical protein